MYKYNRFAATDDDRAQFALFFIKNKEQFSKDILLRNAIVYILSCIEYSTIMFTYNEEDKLIGAVNCWPAAEDHSYVDNGTILFISSAVLLVEERRTVTFMKGFRDLVNESIVIHPNINEVRFTARADNLYLNKLYSKCATYYKSIEGEYGLEHVYYVSYEALRAYLNKIKSR